MCGCQAHHELVNCTCNCDHTQDRLRQYKALADDRRSALMFCDSLLSHIYWRGFDEVRDPDDIKAVLNMIAKHTR